MVKKFHINKHGVPARCHAKEGNCPLTKSEHYNTYAEAQDAVNKMNEEKYGILPENKNRNGIPVVQPKRKKHDEIKNRNGIPVTQPKRKHFNSSEIKPRRTLIESNEFVTATTEVQLKHIENRMLEMSKEGPNAFYHRCRKSDKVHNYIPKNYEDTEHFEKDRSFRAERILETFGEGKLIGYYRVTQEVGRKEREIRTQMIEIRDTGQLIAYDMNTGRKITTFIAQPKRIELMMIKAGDIPNKALLEKMEENKREAYIKKIND